jgi:hypothetical protein
LVTSWVGPCYIDGHPFQLGPNTVQMHLALIPGLGTENGCMCVALLAPLLNIISCLEAVAPFPDLIQGLAKLPPDGPPCSLVKKWFTLFQGRIIQAIFECLWAGSQWHSSMPLLTVKDLHWAVPVMSCLSFQSDLTPPQCPVTCFSQPDGKLNCLLCDFQSESV